MRKETQLAEETVLHAELAGDGSVIAASGGFLTGGAADVSMYLERFDLLDGLPATPGRIVDIAGLWREPGAAIDARTPFGRFRKLCSHPNAAGGITLLSVENTTQHARDALARKVMDRHPMPIWVNDAETGDVYYRNEPARRLFEIEEISDTEGNMLDLFTNMEENRHILKELRAHGTLENYNVCVQSMKGREFWLNGAASMFHHDGRTVVLTIVQDVTTLKSHEAEVGRSRDLLNDALRSLSEGFALYDEEGRLIVCNDAYREINAGVAEFVVPGAYWETLLTETARRNIIPLARERVSAWVAERLEIGDAFGSYQVERADGRMISTTIRPTSLGGFIVTESDDTMRMRAERQAMASERMLSTILEASPANLCMSRIADGDVIYASPSCIELFGAERNTRDQFARVADRADFLTELLPVGAIDDFQAQARREDGSEFPALFSARIIRYRDEEVMVSTVKDLTRQVAAEQGIRDAGIRLRDAIEALSEGFILYDAEERVVKANQRFLDMNAPYADMIIPGTHTRTLLCKAVESGHLVDAQGWLDDYDAELARGEGGSKRAFEFQLADGRWVNSVRRPTREGGFVITWLDVTERKQAAEDLRRMNERMRDAIEALDEGFALYDNQDRLVMWNQRYEELNPNIVHVIKEGVTYQEILETAIATHKLPDEEVAKVRESGRRDKGNYRRRFEFEHKDGRSYTVARNPTSEDGFVVTRLDITERKQAERAQREADELIRHVLQACPVNLIMCRFDDGLIEYVSSNTEEKFGRRLRVSDYWTDWEEGMRMTREMDPDGAIDFRNFQLKDINDVPIPVALSSRRIEFKGKPMVVSQAYDLTERIEMEAELSRQREMLHQSEKLSALGELLAGVAHELNNPLSVVVGHALMLEEEITDQGLLKRTEKISAAAERCSRIVKTFLAMARQRPAKLEQTSVNTVIETALDVAGYGLRSAGVTLRLELADDLPPVLADSDQLAQVFANLIVNAEHVLAGKSENGSLTISSGLSRDGTEVLIDVIDNGPGIPEPIRARIFEPFFTTKTVGEGTGIGLAFCHRIIDTHNGRISVTEADGGGAHFNIALTATQDTARVVEHVPLAASDRGRILVIDDEADVAELISQVLARDGYDVATVGSAEAALELLPGDFDLILSDLNMPGLGGRDFLAEVERRWPDLVSRIGFITGDTMSTGAELFLQDSGRPYLEKPVAPVDLRRLAASMMDTA